MSNALNVVASVHQGFWTDWSKGAVLGLTLTLDSIGSSILASSLTLFITICGIQLWTIVRYIIHQRGTVSFGIAPTPHLERQQRILRNATSAPSTARLMLELAWTCRKSNGKRAVRAYMIGTAAIIYTLAFSVAVIFSSQVISATVVHGNSAVLLKNKTMCGPANQSYLEHTAARNAASVADFNIVASHQNKSAIEARLSLQYAQECYRSPAKPTDTTSSCFTLKQPTLKWNTTNTLDCPFSDELCSRDSGSVVLDTGYIETHTHLGLNARPGERLRYRRVTKCTILNDTLYLQGSNDANTSTFTTEPKSEITYVNYGNNFNRKTQWTYSYSDFASFYSNFTSELMMPYQLAVQVAYGPAQPAYSTSDFHPIPEFRMQQQNADLNLLFLSFTGEYVEAVDDPWFSAHVEHRYSTGAAFSRKRFARDQPISTMACLERHSLCTDHGVCTPLLGFDQFQNDADFATELTPRQRVLLDRMLWAIDWSRLQWIVRLLPKTTMPLSVTARGVAGNSGAMVSQTVSADQWKAEVEFWHAIAMAQFQRLILQWATGQVFAPRAPGIEPLLPATNPSDAWFCNTLVIYSPTHRSFSVLALILVVSLGTLIMVTSGFLERLSALIRKHFTTSDSSKSWSRDHFFTLGRIRTVLQRHSRSLPHEIHLKDLTRSKNQQPSRPHGEGADVTGRETSPEVPYCRNATFSFIKTPCATNTSPCALNETADFERERGRSWIPIVLHDTQSSVESDRVTGEALYERERCRYTGVSLGPRQPNAVPPARLVPGLHERALQRRGFL